MQDGDCVKGGTLKAEQSRETKSFAFYGLNNFTRYGFIIFLGSTKGLFGPTWQTWDFFAYACVFLSKKNNNKKMWLRLICNFSLWL